MPKVIIWRDGAIETEFDPGHRDWRMGRSETNDITLLDPRKSVSRFHAELREENGRWVFIDLNSQNGSWKDGQRVNRLVLEHGHEVLFGDYKFAFEDGPLAAPPSLPTAVVTADVAGATADVPIAPDQTLLMPGKAAPPNPSSLATAPPPVVRQAAKVKAPRKGINPLILVTFAGVVLLTFAALAYRILTDEDAPPQTATVTQPAEPLAPVPADPPAAPPTPAVPPPAEATPPVVPPPATATPTAPPAVVPPAAPPVTATPAPATPKAGPGSTTAPRPKRTPPAAPKDNPAIVTRYDEGRRALSAGRFAEAERAFQAVISQQPNFRDAAALIEQAREGQVAARSTLLADAKELEASGDWARAIAAYERAGADDQAAGARTKMTAAGDDAYRKARQFDARNRAGEAVTWYQRAVEWLPDSDARKATAQARLAALKGGAE